MTPPLPRQQLDASAVHHLADAVEHGIAGGIGESNHATLSDCRRHRSQAAPSASRSKSSGLFTSAYSRVGGRRGGPEPAPRSNPGAGYSTRRSRGFRAVSARHDRASKRWYYRSVKIAALAAIVAFAVSWGLVSSRWPVTTTLRHIAAAPNCGFARLVGLAPARRGEPGYWKSHDRDRDGTACEPWPPHSGRVR